MITPESIQARDLVEQTALNFFIYMKSQRVDDLVNLFLEDAVQEQPFVFPGQKPALVGHKGLRENYEMALGKRHSHTFDILALHRTQEPDCVIVEARGTSILGENGHVYDNRYVAIFRIQGDRIAHLRFYFDPLVAQNAFAKIRGLA